MSDLTSDQIVDRMISAYSKTPRAYSSVWNYGFKCVGPYVVILIVDQMFPPIRGVDVIKSFRTELREAAAENKANLAEIDSAVTFKRSPYGLYDAIHTYILNNLGSSSMSKGELDAIDSIIDETNQVLLDASKAASDAAIAAAIAARKARLAKDQFIKTALHHAELTGIRPSKELLAAAQYVEMPEPVPAASWIIQPLQQQDAISSIKIKMKN